MSAKKRDLNRLRRIVAIQNMYIAYQAEHPGTTKIYIWRNVVYPQYFISNRTLTEYLGINAKKLLRELEERLAKEQALCDQQLSLL